MLITNDDSVKQGISNIELESVKISPILKKVLTERLVQDKLDTNDLIKILKSNTIL